MGVSSTARRLIKFRQRQRRAQLEAPSLLLLRNGDCWLPGAASAAARPDDPVQRHGLGHAFEFVGAALLGECSTADRRGWRKGRIGLGFRPPWGMRSRRPSQGGCMRSSMMGFASWPAGTAARTSSAIRQGLKGRPKPMPSGQEVHTTHRLFS
jgi:hypothetical protein